MGNKNIPIVVAVLLLLLVGGIFAMSSRSAKPAATGSQTSEPTSTKTSLKDLLTGNKNVTCTMNYPASDTSSTKGIVYVSGTKMSGAFKVTADGKEMTSNMVSDGQFMYIWTSATPQGFKMKIDQTVAANNSGTQQGVDVNKQVDVNCSNWSVDNSKFALPAGITFTEIKIPTPSSTAPTNGGALPSSACDAITDPVAKAACLKAVTTPNTY